MIPDKKFKELKHKCAGFNTFLTGESLEKGYKPDFVLKKGNEYIILESENSSSRKTYVGGMVKAAHFLINNKIGTLIFILVPRKNTTAKAIASHLISYFTWIKNLTNMEKVIIIESEKYYSDCNLLEIGSNDFLKNSIIIDREKL